MGSPLGPTARVNLKCLGGIDKGDSSPGMNSFALIKVFMPGLRDALQIQLVSLEYSYEKEL